MPMPIGCADCWPRFGASAVSEPYGFSIFIPGRPVGYVRMTQRSKWREPAQRYLTYRNGVTHAAKAAGAEPVEFGVAVEIVAQYYNPDGVRPDIDNITKMALDALSKVGFKDDRQVRFLTAIIRTANPHFEEEGLEVTVREYCRDR